MLSGSKKVKTESITCSSLKRERHYDSGYYTLKNELEPPKLGFCDMNVRSFPHLQDFIWEIRQLAICPSIIIRRGIYLNLLTDGGPGTLLVGHDGLLQHRVQHNPLHRSDSRPLLPKHLRAL